MEATIEETVRHIGFLARHLSGCECRHVVVVFLMELGVSTRGAGFEYTKQAILLQHEDPTRLYTKHIYPEIAKRFGPYANKCQVERAIGLLIKRSWLKRKALSCNHGGSCGCYAQPHPFAAADKYRCERAIHDRPYHINGSPAYERRSFKTGRFFCLAEGVLRSYRPQRTGLFGRMELY